MPGFKSKAAYYAHKDHVFHDPEFLARAKQIRESCNTWPNKDYLELCKAFSIEDDDEDFDQNPFYVLMNFDDVFSGGTIKYREDNAVFVAHIRPTVTRKQIDGLWQLIKRQKSKYNIADNKMKPPENTQLLYAIFKARKNKKTFKEIFNAYSKGELEGYSSSNKLQYDYEDSLEAYYHRYYPPAT